MVARTEAWAGIRILQLSGPPAFLWPPQSTGLFPMFSKLPSPALQRRDMWQ